MNHFCFLIGLSFLSLHAALVDKFPADIEFLVTDLKYSAEKGVKICEIQQGTLSMFNGTKFFDPDDTSIQSGFLHLLEKYRLKGWTVLGFINDMMLRTLMTKSPFWSTQYSNGSLFNDPELLYLGRKPVFDPSDISNYHGLLYISPQLVHSYKALDQALPGLLVIDRASFPCWVDKYKMTRLFSLNPVLANFKPKWGLYGKKYTPQLASTIIKDLGGEMFVIKPRGAFLGYGVIVVAKSELDSTLKYILSNSNELKKNPDLSYSYWTKDSFDSFIVEEFVNSDILNVPHLENKPYQPTMRIACVCVHDKGEFNVHFLGAYWKMPEFALNEPGSLTQKHKDLCEPPFYLQVDPITLDKVYSELKIALPILHKNMLITRNDD